MVKQLDLFADDTYSNPLFDRFDQKAVDHFKAFHEANPDVYDEFRRMAKLMKDSGRSRYSVDAIINAIRWNRDIVTTGEPFKINNNIRSIYGRLLAFNEPEFAAFFTFREKGEF